MPTDNRDARALKRLAAGLLIAAASIGLPRSLLAQGIDVEDRPIADVRVEGTEKVDPQLVLNQIRTQPGDPYDKDRVAQDIVNITRLGRFSRVQARVEPNPDGSVDLVYVVDEQLLLADVQVVGNKNLTDQKILGQVLLEAGDPADPYLIDRARKRIVEMYKEEGYFLADVTADEQTLTENSVLIFRVREGARPKIKKLIFEGAKTFSAKQLKSKIRTETYMFIFRDGALSEEQLDRDVARLREFYQERGYLDVRVGRRINLSPDQKEATIVFLLDEGPLYTVADIVVDGATLFPEREVRAAMFLKVGDVYSADRLRKTVASLKDLYGKLGFIETAVAVDRVFHDDKPQVDLLVTIEESKQYMVGRVMIRNNRMTQDKVIRRQVRGLEPGRPFDTTGIDTTERRIRGSGLFDEAKITLLGEEEQEVRDVLIEVKEAQTGSISLGAAISSDSGVFGAFDLTQRNFDIADPPASWSEFITGRAFRGAGQFFSLTLQPGDEFQRYQVTFREPYLLDSNYFFDTNLFFFTRDRFEYDEERIGGTGRIGKRFGDVWSASVRARWEQVTARDLDIDAPTDVFDVEGENVIDSFGLFLSRSTVQTDRHFLPYKGTRTELSLSRAGVFGGDFEFTRAAIEFNGYVTLDEDFFGRKTTLRLRGESGYIFEDEEAPIFERFYAGGHRSFRGFDFRGVGPRGVTQAGNTSDTPIGGDWLFLVGLEYNYPIYEQAIRGVFFIDSGTVQEDLGFDEYRVAVGGGLRLLLPFLGQAPLAFDIAYPLVKQDDDDTRVFSFDVALPF